MYEDNTKYLNVDIEKEMRTAFLEYSMSVIVSRALPDVRDGLKPVHRRILYTMHEKGLEPTKGYRKSADTVGAVLGGYHPHGDQSVYDALVRMAQSFSLRYPLVEGQGNFGSVDGDPPAAYRYTEARMSKIAVDMLTDIDKDTVDFGPNYDDTTTEPLVLPARVPNLLINGAVGIAVGMATNIPPHNITEVIDAVCYLIDNPEADLFELMEFIKGPDFPTGGIIMGRAGIRAAYATGRGKITLRSRAEIEEKAGGRYHIIVTELPYMVNKARLVENIADLVRDKRIEGISDLRDESDRDGMRIVIELKKEANPQVVLNRLYSYTQMQDTVGVILLALDNGEPKVMTLKTVLERYVEFQGEVVRRRTMFDLKKATERAHILQGLKVAIDEIDETLRLLRASKGIPEGKRALIERFDLDDVQASAIVAMRFGQLTQLESGKIMEERDMMLAKVAEYEKILASEELIMGIIKTEIAAVREKYGDERKTEIAQVSGEVDIEDLIPVEDSVFTLTHLGYIKRQATDTYQTQKRGGRGITGLTRRDEDFVEELFIASTHDYLLFVTNMGRIYRLKGYEVPEGSRISRGINIVNLLALQPDEKVTSLLRVEKGADEQGYLVMGTKKGIVKRTTLLSYKNIRKSGLIAITLDEGDELAFSAITSGDQHLIVATKNGMAIRFSEADARAVGRTARGVKAIALVGDDVVVGMAVVKQGAALLTVTEKGAGRRTLMEDYRTQYRAGKGIRNYAGKGGKVAGVIVAEGGDDVIIISAEGIIIRMHAEDIALQSRYAGGVRVMRMQESDYIVTVARAERSDDEEDVAKPTDEILEGEAPADDENAEELTQGTPPEDDIVDEADLIVDDSYDAADDEDEVILAEDELDGAADLDEEEETKPVQADDTDE